MRATGIDPSALAETSVAAMQHFDLSAASPVLVEADGGGSAYLGVLGPAGDTVVQASSASDRWVLEVDGRRAERTDAYGWANAFATGDGAASGEAELSYRAPLVRHVLLAVQGALWLAALLVGVRMRFGSEAPPPPDEVEAKSAEPDEGLGDEPHLEPTPEEEQAPEPVTVSAGASA
jgi:hypothetical protein